MARVKKFGKRRIPFKRNLVSSNVNIINSSAHLQDNVNIASNSTDGGPNVSSSGSRPSSSKKKLKCVQMCGQDSEYYGERFKGGNIIISLDILNKHITEFAKCKLCSAEHSLELFVSPKNRKGVVSSLELTCINCNATTSFMSSNRIETDYFEANIRFVYAMRSIGKGHAASQIFCDANVK